MCPDSEPLNVRPPLRISARGPLWLAPSLLFVVVLVVGTLSASRPIGVGLSAATCIAVWTLRRMLWLEVDDTSLRYGMLGRHTVDVVDCERIAYREFPFNGQPRLVYLVLRDGSVRSLQFLSFRRSAAANLARSKIFPRRQRRFIDQLRAVSDRIGLDPDRILHQL